MALDRYVSRSALIGRRIFRTSSTGRKSLRRPTSRMEFQPDAPAGSEDCRVSERLVQFGRRRRESSKARRGASGIGLLAIYCGRFREAVEILDRGATLADTIPEGEFAIYGEHPSMVCRAYGGQVKILMGFPNSGARLLEGSVEYARHRNNAHSLAWALGVAAHVSQVQHEPVATACFASEAIDTAREHGLPQWLALGERCKGWATHQLGDLEGGLKSLTTGREPMVRNRSRPAHHPRRDLLGGELSTARSRCGGTVPSVRRASALHELWRKLSRGGN